jgi:hypothetical protein
LSNTSADFSLPSAQNTQSKKQNQEASRDKPLLTKIKVGQQKNLDKTRQEKHKNGIFRIKDQKLGKAEVCSRRIGRYESLLLTRVGSLYAQGKAARRLGISAL